MVEQLQVTHEHTLDVTWMLTEEEISELRTNDAAKTQCLIYSKLFSNNAWYFDFDSIEDDSKKPWISLNARPLAEDARQSSSTRAWARKGHFDWTISLVLKESVTGIEALQMMSVKRQFDSKDFGWGVSLTITVKQILEIYDQQKSFGFRCVLKGDHFPQITSPAHDKTYGFFDSSTYADTVFIVHQPGRPPLHIFACKNILVSASSHFKTLFESGFSESTSRRRFEVEKLANHEKDDGTSTSALIDQQLLPFYSSEPESTPQPSASENQASNDHANSSAPTPSSEPSRKRIKLEEGNGVDPSAPETTGRLMNAIDVHKTDFRTYPAMISHLHTPVVPFLPVTSNYLVEHFNNELDYSCPLDWLQEQFEELDSPFDWSGVEPCSAAAMYRLSDRYDLEDLRELSLGFIIRSLTVENVPYELFSSLSLDYEAVQKPILEFFVKNWSEVRKTKRFKLVLEQFSLGKLAKGKDLMGKIFEMISLVVRTRQLALELHSL